MGDRAGSNRSLVDAKETFQTLFEMSRLLNTGLDMETLAICVRLCEQVRRKSRVVFCLSSSAFYREQTLRPWPSSSGSCGERARPSRPRMGTESERRRPEYTNKRNCDQ